MKRVNAVVVGAGAAGGIVAKELSMAGLSVVLLERGPWYTSNDCRKDDLRNQRTTVLGNAFGPEDDGNPRVVVDASGAAQTVLPSQGGYQNNAACVGGGTLSYGAMAWRYLPQDFRMRSTYGAPAGSSLEDWPVSYDDLEPFYEKAEYEIGISGDDSGTPFKGARKRPLPMPPLAPNREFQILEPAARRLGLHPFHIPMSRNSVPYNGRGPCMRCRFCVALPARSTPKTARRTRSFPPRWPRELRTAHRLHGKGSPDRRPRPCPWRRLLRCRGHLVEQPSDIVVVSACAIESARLLLNSQSRLFPNGLGNRYDLVGRNLQGHHYTGAVGFFNFDTYDDVGPGASIAVSDYNHGTPGLVGGGMLANEFIRLPIHMVDRLPADRQVGGSSTNRPCAILTSATSSSWGPRSPFPPPTPASPSTQPCATNGECRWPASPATSIRTPSTSEWCRLSAPRHGSRRRARRPPSSAPAGQPWSPPASTRQAPAAWEMIPRARLSIATASSTTWTTSSSSIPASTSPTAASIRAHHHGHRLLCL